MIKLQNNFVCKHAIYLYLNKNLIDLKNVEEQLERMSAVSCMYIVILRVPIVIF